MAEARAYRIFDAELLRATPLTPDMVRITFTGPEVARMATHAPDQRIKLFFPHDDGRPPAIPDRPDWYDVYRALPPHECVPMRTYTIRHLRADVGEVDIDFVLHGENGPASHWALHAKAGDMIQISAPDARHAGGTLGYEWNPPADVGDVLLIADETAIPAAAGILEAMAAWPSRPSVQAFFEVRNAGNRLTLPEWDGLDTRWLHRESAPGQDKAYGAMMIEAAEVARLPSATSAEPPPEDLDSQDGEVLWDRARPADGRFYAWVAGETTAVSRIRKHLVQDRLIDRRALNLMGYWRYGKALV